MLISRIVITVLNCIVFLLHYHSPQDPIIRVQLLKGLVTELCGPSDRHLVTLPLWQATWGLNSMQQLLMCLLLTACSSC